VLAAYPHALLAGCGSPIGPSLISQENILKLVHSRIGKQERRIIERNQGRAGYDFVAVLLEILQKSFTDLIAADQFILLSRSAAILLQE
jgi:hypothetical protein